MTRKRRPPTCPSSCARKTPHATEAEAKRHAEALAVAMPYQTVRTYRCKVCRKWFVTNDRDRPGKRRGGR